MNKVTAGLTTSIDGYYAGPNDSPELGLGEGGEELHRWRFPEVDDSESATGPLPGDQAWLDAHDLAAGAVIGGRVTYDLARAWGGSNPWPMPFFIVTHRPEDEHDEREFRFVGSLDEAIRRASEVAGERPVHLMGGGTLIREALAAGLVDELSIVIAPITLGGGKRLFDGFDRHIELEPLGARHSRYATFLDYRVKK